MDSSLDSGIGAPSFIQCSNFETTAFDNFESGGICKPSCRRALISELSAGLPGTTTGPPSPPRRIPPGVSSSKPPLSLFAVFAVAEWHFQQCSDNCGRISRSKYSIPLGSTSSAMIGKVAIQMSNKITDTTRENGNGPCNITDRTHVVFVNICLLLSFAGSSSQRHYSSTLKSSRRLITEYPARASPVTQSEKNLNHEKPSRRAGRCKSPDSFFYTFFAACEESQR